MKFGIAVLSVLSSLQVVIDAASDCEAECSQFPTLCKSVSFCVSSCRTHPRLVKHCEQLRTVDEDAETPASSTLSRGEEGRLAAGASERRLPENEDAATPDARLRTMRTHELMSEHGTGPHKAEL
eukprot:TRINITY_DN45724_c0_g1_i1.p2 TRINITY_DN45724_c0_g1~~TRINITY_DN45724_c0_g1_i1.p2  ORF type:complete len:125 (-),score=21.68 TRINITY_DN45724_c0_g1_i1:99-473(-)